MNELPQQFIQSAITPFSGRQSNYHLDQERSTGDNYTFNAGAKGSEDSLEVKVNRANGDFTKTYNIAPTKTAVIIYGRKEDGKTKYIIETLTFGLLPIWAGKNSEDTAGKSPTELKKVILHLESRYFNCRKESLTSSRVWNSAKKTRCVVPIQGYFEWMKTKGKKTPYYVYPKDSSLLFLAGFYSHNSNFKNQESDDSDFISSFTIVTGPAHKADIGDISWLHDRKPIILMAGSELFHKWLDPDAEWSDAIYNCLETSKNEAYSKIASYTVDQEVGNTKSEGEHLIEKRETKPKKSISDFFAPETKVKREEGNESSNHKGTKRRKSSSSDEGHEHKTKVKKE